MQPTFARILTSAPPRCDEIKKTSSRSPRDDGLTLPRFTEEVRVGVHEIYGVRRKVKARTMPKGFDPSEMFGAATWPFIFKVKIRPPPDSDQSRPSWNPWVMKRK